MKTSVAADDQIDRSVAMSCEISLYCVLLWTEGTKKNLTEYPKSISNWILAGSPSLDQESQTIDCQWRSRRDSNPKPSDP